MMGKPVRRGLVRYVRRRGLLEEAFRFTPPLQRTPKLFERLFPSVIWGDDTKNVYLTFDDGPDPDNTPPLLDALGELGVHAVFFVLGETLPERSTLLDRIVDEGHLLGYHGLSHDPWWFKNRVQRRIRMDADVLPMATPPLTTPLLLRPPYGRFDFAVVGMAREMDAQLMLWRHAPGDWIGGMTERELASRLWRNTRGGDIVLLHDGGMNGHFLPSAVTRAVPLLRRRGLEIGDPSNLLHGFAR